MAISKRHSRKITFEDEVYRWKFDHDWGKRKGTIAVQLADEKVSCKLIITLPNWTDSYAYPFDETPNEPKIITPSVIQKMMTEAIETGWNPFSNGSYHVYYESKTKKVKLRNKHQ